MSAQQTGVLAKTQTGRSAGAAATRLHGLPDGIPDGHGICHLIESVGKDRVKADVWASNRGALTRANQ